MPNYESCLSCNFYDEFDDVCKMGHMCCKGEMWPVSNRPKSNTPLMVKGISLTYEGRVGNCPKCGKLIQESKTRYFHDEKDCGQAILWGDVNKYSKSIKTWRIE